MQVDRDGTLIEVPLDHVFDHRATQADVYDRASGTALPPAAGCCPFARQGSGTARSGCGCTGCVWGRDAGVKWDAGVKQAGSAVAPSAAPPLAACVDSVLEGYNATIMA